MVGGKVHFAQLVKPLSSDFSSDYLFILKDLFKQVDEHMGGYKL